MVSAENAAALFYRSGTPFSGTARTNDRGRAYALQLRRCSRCGGAGRSEQWRYTGLVCYDCGGVGHLGNEEVPLYTAAELEKLNAAADKRERKREAKRLEAAAAREAAAAINRAAFDATYAELIARCAPILEADVIAADILARGRERGALSDKQIALLVSKCERLEAARAIAVSSSYYGACGERIEADVTVTATATYERAPFMRTYYRDMETVFIVTMADAAGHLFVSKSPRFEAERGEQFRLSATVKEHSEYRGAKQTIVTRARRLEARS